jgi:catechol 2,3-dioxygenase-like lactoylglutathione lyase family enzyme
MPAASRPCDYGAGHLCLYVDDVEALHAHMVELGFSARSAAVVDISEGPNRGARSCYLTDPDGYAVELFQKRPGA